MGKKKGGGNVLDIPVEFGGVSIADATARLGIRIDRSVCSVKTADDVFCGHRLSGRVVLGGNGDGNGQKKFVDDLDHQVGGVFDVKRFGANQKQIATGLTFSLADVDITELAKFSKGSGRLIIDNVAELPEDEAGDADEHAERDEAEDIEQRPILSKDWRSKPIGELGLTTGVNDMLAEVKVTTLGGLAEFKEAIDGSKAIWPKGIGPAKAEEIAKRLENYIDKHEHAGAGK